MKKAFGLLAGAMLAMAHYGDRAKDLFVEPIDPYEGESDEDRKRRFHSMNPTDTSEREFIVKGERIMAHDKKTALKIYTNRHPEAKGKKRKKK